MLLATATSCRHGPPAALRRPTGRNHARAAMRHPMRPPSSAVALRAAPRRSSLREHATAPSATQCEVPRDLMTSPTACIAGQQGAAARSTAASRWSSEQALLLLRHPSSRHKRKGPPIPSNSPHLLLFLRRQPRWIEYRQWVPAKQSRLSTLNLRKVGPLFLS